ncbi:MAG: hypothetical protein LBF12_03150 [Christensenellaceae bacterium]|jgi:hypothetical protein|nr:hypothetical protein [Christensenellaceae bacterium]
MKRFFDFCETTFRSQILRGGTLLYREKNYFLRNTEFPISDNDKFAESPEPLIDRPAIIAALENTVPALIMIYPGLNDNTINELEGHVCDKSLRYERGPVAFTNGYKEFLRMANGTNIMLNRIALYGDLQLTKKNIDLPYSPSSLYLTRGNCSRPPSIPNHLIEIGVYKWNFSHIFLDSLTEKIYVFDGDYHKLLKKWTKKNQIKYREMQVPLLGVWENLGDFLIEETTRIWGLYKHAPMSFLELGREILPNQF